MGGIHLSGEPIHNSLLFLVTITVSLVLLLIMLRIVRSPFGRALDAIGQQRTRARFLGLPVKRYVWAAFIISGFYGGVAGGLYAIFFTSGISPTQTLEVFVSGDILYMAILGGFNTLTGPFIGGIVFEVLANLASDFSLTGPGGEKEVGRLITGIVLLVIVFAFPSGIVGSLRRGGRVREAAATFKNDPSVLGPWLSQAATGTVDAAKRAVKNIRILLLGVK
jgi:branched-chain amino acid transport system permease protein